MQLGLFSLFVFLAAAPISVFACEGECIVGITNVFLGNYSAPIQDVLGTVAKEISTELIPSHSQNSPPITYLAPLIDAYNKAAYDALENAIFPSYFHGKCQDKNGVDPAGCPNPDCPVVCGTPGSLVHFYEKLRSIVYEETKKMLVTLASPGGPTYNEVKKAVLADAGTAHKSRMNRRYGPVGISRCKRADDLEAGLKNILKKIPSLLEKACGEGQVSCSWEAAMKAYILSFP